MLIMVDLVVQVVVVRVKMVELEQLLLNRVKQEIQEHMDLVLLVEQVLLDQDQVVVEVVLVVLVKTVNQVMVVMVVLEKM
jgi:hypothetical protein